MSFIICEGSLYTHCCRASPLLQLGFLVRIVLVNVYTSQASPITGERIPRGCTGRSGAVSHSFLADRTNGRDYATVLCPSAVCL